jgi:hypothetical protein
MHVAKNSTALQAKKDKRKYEKGEKIMNDVLIMKLKMVGIIRSHGR